MKEYSLEEARALIGMARLGLELRTLDEQVDNSVIEETFKTRINERAVVRLLFGPTRMPIGISGLPETRLPINKAVVEAAASALQDANIESMTDRFLNDILVELTIVSEPIALSENPRKREKTVEAGRHGVLLEYGSKKSYAIPAHMGSVTSGVELLEHVCKQASLPSRYWTQPKISLYKFEAQTFIEQEPNGEVVRL